MMRPFPGVSRIACSIGQMIAAAKRVVSDRRARWLLIGVCTLVLAASAAEAWEKNRYSWEEKNFREVVPGQVYAGAYQQSIPLKRILEQYHIKTVLTLLPEGFHGEATERRVLEECGVQFRRVPIPTDKSQRGMFDTVEEFLAARLPLVEEAANLLADSQNQPVFVHCEAGRHRTGAVVAVFRVRHCGWSEWDARKELKRYYGLDRHAWWPSLALHDYYAKHANGSAEGLRSIRASSVTEELCKP